MTLRFYEAWTVAPDGEVIDECGHDHDTLADARESHRYHRNYDRIVAIDYAEDGTMSVAREYPHRPRRPRNGFEAIVDALVNA